MPKIAAPYDPSRPVVVLAPHLQFPPRHGADILIAERWRAFSRHVPKVHVLACSSHMEYENGIESRAADVVNTMRSKVSAVARTLMRGSHYLYEKFLTADFERTAQEVLQNIEYGTVVSSYLCTATLLDRYVASSEVLGLVETHNDDFKWFDDIARETPNPLVRKAASLSRAWTETYFRAIARKYVFLHVTDKDREGYAAYDPEHTSLLAPIGVRVDGSFDKPREANDRIRLLFVGSLGTHMNADALAHFADRFYPELHRAFGRRLVVTAAGSSPSRRVRKLCSDMNWKLEANVPEKRLEELYTGSTCSILPFKYATGAKLKVLESLSYGVPFLGTTEVDIQLDEIRPPCLLSNDPMEWSRHLRRLAEHSISLEKRNALIDQARSYSWTRIAHRLHNDLLKLGA